MTEVVLAPFTGVAPPNTLPWFDKPKRLGYSVKMRKNPFAVALGKLGKGKTSPSKAVSSKRNGKLGGRPPSEAIRDWTVFMDAVDECRRKKSVEPLHFIFLRSRRTKERALIHATAKYLCFREFKIPAPKWASASMWLKDPWFVSGIENLKAMALIESPMEFRCNHIFVLSNFLSRV